MAKRVKFLKDHLRHKAGEKALITDEAANYFIRCGVAVLIKEDAPEVKQNAAPKSKRKSKK